MGFESTGTTVAVGLSARGIGSAVGGYGPSEWTPPLIDEDDPRVVAALEQYLSAAERGEPLDRRAFLARHAELAPRLGACLESLDRLADAAHHFDPLPHDDTGPFLSASMDLHPPSRLGDYQIVREIGRGGMGIVYEAEQVSLGRRVALKLLPFTAAIDPRQVQRFQVEVQAAAHLHHPHIVPVYAVGCESGIHYYAMQLISGQSLAAIIAGLRELRANKPGLWSSGNGSEPLLSGQTSTIQGDPPRGLSLGHERRPGAFFRQVARWASRPPRLSSMHIIWAWSTGTSSRRTS